MHSICQASSPAHTAPAALTGAGACAAGTLALSLALAPAGRAD